MKILPKESGFGATIEGLDLSSPLTGEQHQAVVQALGNYGVVNFPRQQLDARQLRQFSGSFGTLEINGKPGVTLRGAGRDSTVLRRAGFSWGNDAGGNCPYATEVILA